MNVRQYTPEGTFAAAQQELPRLKELGIDILWLMPIHPIGVKERKGTLGSYYAIADYKAINPEFGTMEDFESFLAAAHKLGFRVVLDCVANHTSPDAKWINECPADWYMRDSLGNTVVNYDWYDIAELNYGKREVWDAMADQIHFLFGNRVKSRSRLVHNNNLLVACKDSCNRNLLCFTTREHRTLIVKFSQMPD